MPRPETELLVDVALRDIPRKAEWQVLDLGTGSGAVALAIGRERPSCYITATDISADALAAARENANGMITAYPIPIIAKPTNANPASAADTTQNTPKAAQAPPNRAVANGPKRAMTNPPAKRKATMATENTA